MNQVAERILFAVDGDTVHTQVQIVYRGTAEDFAWILPVPSAPRLSVSHNELFRQLQEATEPFFQLLYEEDSECFYPPESFFGIPTVETPSPQITVTQQRVGPYEAAVVTSDDPQAVLEWLGSNGYEVSAYGAGLLQPYVDEGFSFVALRLAPDRDVGDLQPIALSYPSANPAIPIRLTAVATEPDLGLLVWILGPSRAVPVNYLHVRINEALISWADGGANYADVVTQAADEAGGQAFVTDYAGSPDVMRSRLLRASFDLETLRATADPARFVDELLRQRFPPDPQMQGLLRRHLPIPPAVLEEGILQRVFGGNQEAYDRARSEGRLGDIAERSFYNEIDAYAPWLEGYPFDPVAFADDLELVVLTPLRQAEELFAQAPYLTRLYTTLSAGEMTVDPVFDFNPDLPEIGRWRFAEGRFECGDFVDAESNYEELILVVTLADGRQVRSRPYADGLPGARGGAWAQPPLVGQAAAVVERMGLRGGPQVISRMTSVATPADSPRPGSNRLGAGYPNPFNAAVVIPFTLSDPGRARLTVFDLLGRRVATLTDGHVLAGDHALRWDGTDAQGRAVASGVYAVRLNTGGGVHTRKVLLLR